MSQLSGKKILVTGGTGYIGSHTVVQLLEANVNVVIVDNLCNSSEVSLERVKQITSGKEAKFHNVDIRDADGLKRVFDQDGPFDAVVHFAGLKAVGESVKMPLEYFHNNVYGTLVLLDVMRQKNCKRIVFSSSATVYGSPETMPIREDFPTGATNPYGRSKLHLEEIMKDLVVADPEWSVVLLRYFNPVGAHPSGLIGEDPRNIPNNLNPYILQVLVGRLPHLNVFGSDYPTPDGTGVRDYLHVMDLADGHLAALAKILSAGGSGDADTRGTHVYNLGTGKGYSVLEMAAAMEQAAGKPCPRQMRDRRPGDAALVYADCSKAARELGWTATRSLQDMCRDAWNWQSNNPYGFSPPPAPQQ